MENWKTFQIKSESKVLQFLRFDYRYLNFTFVKRYEFLKSIFKPQLIMVNFNLKLLKNSSYIYFFSF
jgi:hypothetical protein